MPTIIIYHFYGYFLKIQFERFVWVNKDDEPLYLDYNSVSSSVKVEGPDTEYIVEWMEDKLDKNREKVIVERKHSNFYLGP